MRPSRLSRYVAILVLALLYQAVPLQAGERPFLWKAVSKTATVYLLGSIHVARPDLYPLDRRIRNAFESSEILVVEADPTGAGGITAAGLMLASGTYADGDSLDRHLPKKLLDAAATRFASYGMPAEQWKRFRPWFAAMTITMAELQRLGMTPEHGIDVHFLQQAQGSKRILELEGAEAQIRMLSGLPEEEERLFLEYTLRDVDALSKQTDELVAAWRSGDAGSLETLLFEPVRSEPRLEPIYAKLFHERNLSMAETIAGYLEGRGTYFVIAGAGHLVGKTGLVTLLGNRFEVAQVP